VLNNAAQNSMASVVCLQIEESQNELLAADLVQLFKN